MISSGWENAVSTCPITTSTLRGTCYVTGTGHHVLSSAAKCMRQDAILQVGKLRRGDQTLAQDHPAAKWQSQDLNLGRLTSDFLTLLLHSSPSVCVCVCVCVSHTHTHTLGWAAWNPSGTPKISRGCLLLATHTAPQGCLTTWPCDVVFLSHT